MVIIKEQINFALFLIEKRGEKNEYKRYCKKSSD